MQAETRRRQLKEDEEEREGRKAQQQAKEDARNRSMSSKAGTFEIHACDALQHETVMRRVKQAADSAGTYDEALRLAGQDIKDMSANPFLGECIPIEDEVCVDHLELYKDCQQFWACCLKCSTRLVRGYYICKGCLHSAWCSMECYNADTARHVQVWIVYICTLENLHCAWLPRGSFHITHTHLGTYMGNLRTLNITPVAGVPQLHVSVGARRIVAQHRDTRRTDLHQPCTRGQSRTPREVHDPDHLPGLRPDR